MAYSWLSKGSSKFILSIGQAAKLLRSFGYRPTTLSVIVEIERKRLMLSTDTDQLYAQQHFKFSKGTNSSRRGAVFPV